MTLLVFFLNVDFLRNKMERRARFLQYICFPNGNFFGELTNFGDILTNHFWCEFLVYIWTKFFSSLLFFQQAGSMPGGATWAESQWNHVWVSPQLLKNSFTTSGQQDSNPLLSIFDSQHRNFGWNHTDSHQFWLLKMAG
jgi:hypothetical protein